MRTALALVAVLGLIGGGVVLSSPPKKQPLRVQAVAPSPAAVQSAVPGGPATPGISPRGWIVSSPTGGAFVPRIVEFTPGVGFRDSIPGGMLGSTHYGDNQFSSPSLSPSKTWMKVYVNGPSEVHLPGRSGFGPGPSTPGGSFSLSNGITVTAVP